MIQMKDAYNVCFISSSAKDPLQHLSETTSTSLISFFFCAGGKARYVLLHPDSPADRRGIAALTGKIQ